MLDEFYDKFYIIKRHLTYHSDIPKGVWRMSPQRYLEGIYGMSEWYVRCLDVYEGKVRTSQVRIGQARTGQVRTGHVRTG